MLTGNSCKLLTYIVNGTNYQLKSEFKFTTTEFLKQYFYYLVCKLLFLA